MGRAHRSRRKPSQTLPAGNGVRKHSPSPTTHPGAEQSKPSDSPTPRAPWWTEPSPPAPATGKPSWLILDRIVHRSGRRRGVVGGDATASDVARDCVGRSISASLRIAEPPAVSRLYLHWLGMPSVSKFAEPTAIAAHRSSILFRVTVPFEDSMWWHQTCHFPDDYFVYSSSSPPSLTLLPPCFDGDYPDLKLKYKAFQPHSCQQQLTMFDDAMGILCHGDKGEFTVAHLTFRFHQGVEAQLCLLHRRPHDSMEWSVKKLQIPSNMEINPYSWKNDVVVPIGGRCLCWVDYYQGMLLLDVVTANKSSSPDQQQLLHYVQLPSKALRSRRVYMEVTEPDPLRCLSVSDAGIIKLVCIITKELPSPSYPFTITTWALVDIQHGRWEMDAKLTMRASEFFRLCAAQSCLPRVQPSFPVVSLVDPDVVCFLLRDMGHNLFWMIQVNMREKLLQSSAIYINEEEEGGGYPPKRASRNKFFGYYFIPSKFSSYLSVDAITSLELSGKMQKEKEASVVLKCGLEAQAKE